MQTEMIRTKDEPDTANVFKHDFYPCEEKGYKSIGKIKIINCYTHRIMEKHKAYKKRYPRADDPHDLKESPKLSKHFFDKWFIKLPLYRDYKPPVELFIYQTSQVLKLNVPSLMTKLCSDNVVCQGRVRARPDWSKPDHTTGAHWLFVNLPGLTNQRARSFLSGYGIAIFEPIAKVTRNEKSKLEYVCY